MRAGWIAMGALAASAVVAGPAAAQTLTAKSGRGSRDAATVLPVRRVDWPEFLAKRSATASPSRFAAPAAPAPAEYAGSLETWGYQESAGQQGGGLGPAQAQAPLQFDITPGPLGTALTSFERVTGLSVEVPNDNIRTLNSPGVSGVFSAEQALAQLLTGTGVSYRFTGARTVALDLRIQADAVEVTGRTLSVSSPKYTEPLRDIPQTITVIPRGVMEEQGAVTLRDVLRNVAGITFQAGEGGVPAGDQMTIRGFSARTDMFIDGVRDFGGYSRDAFNLEQVEVTKGPSSSIAGRGSTGGSINQVTKSPQLGASYDGAIGVGNAAYKRSTIDINQPLEGLGANTAFRLNAMWTDTEVANRDEVGGERWGIAPSLGFGIGTPTRLTLSYLHLAQDNLPEYGLPWVPANTNPQLEQYSNGMPPVDQSNFYGLKTRDYEKTDTDVATVSFERDFSSQLTLRNLTRYGQNDRDSVITAPRFASVNTSTAINRQLQSRDMIDEIVSNQTTANVRLQTGKLHHAIATGLEFSRETSENFARSGPTAPTADLFNPNPNDPYPGPITRTGASTRGTADSASAYAFDTVSIGQWEFSGGLRFDRFEAETEAVAVGGVVTPFERTDNAVSWRAGAVYKPRPNGSIYLGYGTSFNPSAEGLALSAATVLLDPEETRSVEVGTKWDLMQERVSLTSAIFRTEKTNARTPGINPGDPPTVLEGEQVVNGVEFGITGRMTSRWSAIGSAAFMSSDIAASNTPTELDNALALTPEKTFSLWTTYDLPRNITVGGGVQYMDSVFRNATNTASVPSYWLLNTVVSYAVNQNLTLRLNGNNLADEEYVDRVGGGHYIPGAGRTVFVTLAVNY
jgi:catecholate siderophore receptor